MDDSGDAQRASYTRETDTRSPDTYRNCENRNTGDSTFMNYRSNNQLIKWCRYCKNVGHEIEECRKRKFNNSRMRQGNAENPSRATDELLAKRSQDQSRSINTIET